MREQSTHQRILVEAQDLIQRHGFFGLSLQELADRISIRKPSLYAHYESKESLGLAVLTDYQKQFETWAESVKLNTVEEKIHSFLQLFENWISQGKVCPNSCFGLEGPKLPAAIRTAYLHYLETQLNWMQNVIVEFTTARGCETDSRFLAKFILQELIGAQLMARVSGDPSAFQKTKEKVVQLVLSCEEYKA